MNKTINFTVSTDGFFSDEYSLIKTFYLKAVILLFSRRISNSKGSRLKMKNTILNVLYL